MLEDRLIKEIIDSWSSDQAHPNRDRAQKALPEFGQVKTLVESAFLASLKREEDNPLKFALVLASPKDADDCRNEFQSPEAILRFQRPIRLSVEGIAKLSPAFDPNLSALAIGMMDSHEEMMIWGVFNFTPTSNKFNNVPVVILGKLANRPDLFTIYVRQPGSLLIARSNAQIGRIINGEFHEAKPTPFTTGSLGDYLINYVRNHELFRKYENLYWHVFRDGLSLILSESAARGHGSTIVLVDSSDEESFTNQFTARYSFAERVSLKQLYDEVLSVERDIVGGIARRKLVLERIQSIAQLAAVDGAVVLTMDLDLLAYGVSLTAPKWDREVIMGPDGIGNAGGRAFDHLRLGTRHNSAIDFVGKCDGSVAFVISQDGPVRAFLKRDANTVLCWPDCGISMFL